VLVLVLKAELEEMEDCILINSIRLAVSFTSSPGEEGGGVYNPLEY
jgi:hypothetical protein